MALTYQDHIDRAHRAAALALTLPPPTGPALDQVRILHDDTVRTLAEATRLIWTSALGEPRAERARAGIPTAREMLDVLEAYPRLAIPTAIGLSPAERWSDRPTELREDVTPVGAWQVLAAETFLARSCLDQMQTRLTTPVRAAVLTDLAITAEALATAAIDLAAPASPGLPEGTVRRARELASIAARLQRDTAGAVGGRGPFTVPQVAAAREARHVQIIRQPADVAPALANLGRLTLTGQPRAAELFAMTIMLATLADALASGLDAAARAPALRDPGAHAAPIATLTAYRRELTELVRQHQPKLASLGPGNPAADAQARELRTAGVPRLLVLATSPELAAVAGGDLRRIAATLAPVTSAIQAGFAALERRGEMLTYDWAPGPGLHWRRATGVDAEPLLNGLDHASRTARSLRAQSPAAPPNAAAGASYGTGIPCGSPGHRRATARVVDLADALDRRRSALLGEGHASLGGAKLRCAASASLPTPAESARSSGAPAIPR